MLANLWLERHGSPVVIWPDEAIGSVSPIRARYLAASKSADGGDFEPFLALHRQFLRAPDPSKPTAPSIPSGRNPGRRAPQIDCAPHPEPRASPRLAIAPAYRAGPAGRVDSGPAGAHKLSPG